MEATSGGCNNGPTNNNSCKYYPTIFRQYLQLGSLSVNKGETNGRRTARDSKTTRTTTSGTGGADELAVEGGETTTTTTTTAGAQDDINQTICSSNSNYDYDYNYNYNYEFENERGQQQLVGGIVDGKVKERSVVSRSSRIASALSRLRIRRRRADGLSLGPASALMINREDEEEEENPSGGRREERERPTSGFYQLDKLDQPNQQVECAKTKSRNDRRGFLYLKTTKSSDVDRSRPVAQRVARVCARKINADIDLNNNNSCALKLSTCRQTNANRLNDELKTLLLVEEEEEEGEAQETTDERLARRTDSFLEYPIERQVKRQVRSECSMSDNQVHRSAEAKVRRQVGVHLAVALGLLLACVGGVVFGQAQQQQHQGASRGGGGLGSQQQQQQQQRQVQPVDGQFGGSSRGDPAAQAQTPPASGSLVANVNCNKIKGHVTLTPNAQGGGTTVSTQIASGPPGEVYQWSIHQFPVKPGASACSCSALVLGAKLVDLSEMHGNLPAEQEFSVQSTLSLFGADSPVGHSLLLRGMKTGMQACATFLPTSRKSNYRAKFHAPLSGSVTLFQTAFGTSFISHLMYSNGTRRHSTHRFELVRGEGDLLLATSLAGGAPAGSAAASGARGDSAALQAQERQREHEHELSQCRRLSGDSLLRNSSFIVSASTENFGMRARTALVLPPVALETLASVFVVIYSEQNPNEPMACAPLRFVRPKSAAAKFQSVSVHGSVVFTQDSAYDPTVARVSLTMANSDAHSYGIDELPMIIRRKSDTRICPNIREIIYNPHHVEPSSVPPEGEASSDQYAVGDLSGKYGSLAGKPAEKLQVSDFNLPLFGPTSVVGRALTIYSAEGVALACSNVELTAPMTTAFATFDFGVQGQFIFRQPLNDCGGDTYVYIEVSKPTGSAHNAHSNSAPNLERSVDHNWHVHANPVDSGLDHLSTTDCAPAGGHFNPYNPSTVGVYSRDCTPFNALRCELGDLAAKMFTLDIPPYKVKNGQEPDIGKFFATDIDLPLCGPVSVVNRSVVVHTQDFGSQRLACSTIIEFKPRVSPAARARR